MCRSNDIILLHKSRIIGEYCILAVQEINKFDIGEE